MKLRRLMMVGWLALLSVPGIAGADEPEVAYDARVAGYGKEIKTPYVDSGTSGAWLIFTPLALVALGVMFKNANRSHLD